LGNRACKFAYLLNKQSRTPEKGWSSSYGVGRVANNSSSKKHILLRNVHTKLRTWTDTLVRLRNEKGTWDLVRGMLGVCTGQTHSQQQPGN